MIDRTALSVFAAVFAFVTVLGFVAANWHRGDLDQLHEWALGGGRFGTIVTWFLLGGDQYTAYTFIAIPALMYGAGAIGFFAVSYTLLAYPFGLLVLPRLWTLCKQNGYITAADIVYGRSASRSLEFVVALTGILAVMPYIALQLVGIQVVIASLGLTGSGLIDDIPLIIAFVILATYTYTSGLRAPAMIAFVKDTLIFITAGVGVILISPKLGGFGNIFSAAQSTLAKHPQPASILIAPTAFPGYISLILGSILILFLTPHMITGTLSAKSVDAVRRNTTLLPAYSLLLALIALLGYMALAAGIIPKTTSETVPLLFKAMFPSWFLGVAYSAIAIGALVPAAIMSIAAASIVTRNIYSRYFRPNATDAEESHVAKVTSLIVKLGALIFIVCVPTQYAINFQLLAGVWILQTLPALAFGLFSRCMFHERALLGGWIVGMILGTSLSVSQQFSPITSLHFGSVSFGCYTALIGLIANLTAMGILTPLLDMVGIKRKVDARTLDYSY